MPQQALAGVCQRCRTPRRPSSPASHQAPSPISRTSLLRCCCTRRERERRSRRCSRPAERGSRRGGSAEQRRLLRLQQRGRGRRSWLSPHARRSSGDALQWLRRRARRRTSDCSHPLGPVLESDSIPVARCTKQILYRSRSLVYQSLLAARCVMRALTPPFTAAAASTAAASRRRRPPTLSSESALILHSHIIFAVRGCGCVCGTVSTGRLANSDRADRAAFIAPCRPSFPLPLNGASQLQLKVPERVRG